MNLTYDTFEDQISVKDITWNTKQRIMTIGKTHIILTATELRLLYPLRHGMPISYAGLAGAAYKCDLNRRVRVMLDKHFDRIRGKLRGTGFYVYCVLGYGYLLFTEDEITAMDMQP